MTTPYFTATSRRRPEGRARRYRSVPPDASPAIDSPESNAAPRGRKKGCSRATAVSAANSPLCLIIW